MRQYLNLLDRVVNKGVYREDRTGICTYGVFGHQMRFSLCKSFPLLTTKKIFVRGVIEELLWFLSGDTNKKTLQAKGVKIWNEWGDDETGELGPIYGYQWRNWGNREEGKGRDQIAELFKGLRDEPFSRRHIVTAWNPDDVADQALPPCHCLFQCYVHKLSKEERWAVAPLEDQRKVCDYTGDWHAEFDYMGIPRLGLSLQLYQRSADVFLGVPFNIASYSFLTCMLAQQLGYAPWEFIWTGGDCHLYANHKTQAREQLGRYLKLQPTLKLHKAPDIFSYQLSDFEIINYDPHPHIPAPVAV